MKVLHISYTQSKSVRFGGPCTGTYSKDFGPKVIRWEPVLAPSKYYIASWTFRDWTGAPVQAFRVLGLRLNAYKVLYIEGVLDSSEATPDY